MQTFIFTDNPVDTAMILDTKRLGKQRVEAVQIINILLGYTQKNGWANHPAVKMWKGYEAYLVKVYLKAMIDEWDRRGYKGPKCKEYYNKFLYHLKDIEPIKPYWFDESFFLSHKSNLIRKLPEYYSNFFIGIPINLPYIWPKN